MMEQWENLEFGFIADIGKSKARYEQFLEFQWEYYSELAFRRNKIYDSLKDSLRENARPYEFASWQRAVKYKYSLNPLHTSGSRADPGGRFNIGAIDPSRYPVFPALYIASDKGTALAEILGHKGDGAPLTPEELALTEPDSVCVVSISGKLESVLDTSQVGALEAFVSLIREFKLSDGLVSKARKLGLRPLQLINTVERLRKELSEPKWRVSPMQLDVPAAPQIFGRIVLDAGIEGILYISALTDKYCMAVYPQNFGASTSFIELDDATPSESVPGRIDANSFRNFI